MLLWMLILVERRHQCFRRLSLGAKFDTVVTADLFLGGKAEENLLSDSRISPEVVSFPVLHHI